MLDSKILDLQKNIEEKRQIFGKKFENFLTSKSHIFLKKADHFLHSKSFIFWSVSLVFLLSIFLRSTLNIGANSASYIDLSTKLLSGKYYHNFFTDISPLSFFFHLIPHLAAKFTGLNQIILSDIFVNLLGIFSICASTLILRKSRLTAVDQNIIILSFALGIFLRAFDLQSNEFSTNSSFFLIFAFPYIAFSFARKTTFSNAELYCRGALAGLIPCFNFTYAILPLIIETHLFWQKKSPKFFLNPDKLLMILISLGYLLFMINFTPEFFEFLQPMWSSIHSQNSFKKYLEALLEIVFFSGIFLIFLREKFQSENKILLAVFLAASLIFLFCHSESTFLALSTASIFKIFYDFLKSEEFNFAKNKFILGFLLIWPFLDAKGILELESIAVFCWIAIPFIIFYFYKSLQNIFSQDFTRKNISKDFLSKIFLSFISLLIFSIQIIQKNQDLFVLSSSITLLLFLFFFEKTYEKFYPNFSFFFCFIQFFIFSSLTAAYFLAISESYYGNSPLKSPNFLSNNIINFSKTHLSKNDDKILIISANISDIFPALTYLEKPNQLISSSSEALYEAISSKDSHPDEIKDFTLKYLSQDLKNQITKKDNKILFINNLYNGCQIGFLEYYFRDPELKKIFLRDYQFAGRIFAAKDLKSVAQTTFLAQETDIFDQANLSKQKPHYDFEIYLRKNNQ